MRYYEYDLTKLRKVTPELEYIRCKEEGERVHIQSFDFDFDFDEGTLPNKVRFLKPFRIKDAVRCTNVPGFLNTVTLESDSGTFLCENTNPYLQGNIVKDTLLMECIWNGSSLAIESVIYNISKRKMITYPYWIKR